jgi:hypothetical protein
MNSQPQYENVPFDEHEGSSTTEVEESLLGDEKLMRGEEFRQRHATKSKGAACLAILSQARWLLDTVLLLVILWLLVRDQSQKAISKTSENEVGGDFTGVGPHCRQLPRNKKWQQKSDNRLVSTQVTTFHINQTFAPYNTSEFFREEVLTAWNELMPRKNIY